MLRYQDTSLGVLRCAYLCQSAPERADCDAQLCALTVRPGSAQHIGSDGVSSYGRREAMTGPGQ